MYYTGVNNRRAVGSISIGRAESPDGFVWFRPSKEKVLAYEDTAPWSTIFVSHPYAMIDGAREQLWFSAFSPVDNCWEIGYASRTIVPVADSASGGVVSDSPDHNPMAAIRVR
jgi:hypothetical protein